MLLDLGVVFGHPSSHQLWTSVWTHGGAATSLERKPKTVILTLKDGETEAQLQLPPLPKAAGCHQHPHSRPASSCSLIALVGINYTSDAVNGARFAARPETASVTSVLYLSSPGLQPGWQDPQGGTV